MLELPPKKVDEHGFAAKNGGSRGCFPGLVQVESLLGLEGGDVETSHDLMVLIFFSKKKKVVGF